MKKKYIFTIIVGLSFLFFISNFSLGQTMTGAEICSKGKINNSAAISDGSMITPHNPFNILHYKLNFDLYNNFLTPVSKIF